MLFSQLDCDVCIPYIYDASGVKQEKIVYDASLSSSQSTYYADNYIYKKGSAQSPVTLTFFNSEEGYVEPVFEQVTVNSSFGSYTTTRLTGFEYTYQYKDHLGNIRLSYQDMNGDGVIDSITEIKEENHYYPFGLKHKGYNNQIVGRDHQYGYGGKEENDELGLEWLDFSARNYHSELGRWSVVDALADHPNQIDKSPYAYAWNNPTYYNDPDGNCPKCWDWLVSVGEGALGRLEQMIQPEALLGPVDVNGLVKMVDGMVGSPEAIKNTVGIATPEGLKEAVTDPIKTGEVLVDVASVYYGPKIASKIPISRAFKKLNIGGGAKSKYNDAYNVDPMAKSGFKGTLDDFIKKHGTKFDEVIVDNPQFNFLEGASKVLNNGGTITVRGTMANKFFNKIANGKADGLGNYKASSKKAISNKGFSKTNGDPIVGDMFEIILTKQ